MNRVLLLGGTGDALALARGLRADDIYSLAGLGKTPQDLRCRVRVGGFGGAPGLCAFLREQRIALLLDATHPYAQRISNHASQAADEAGIAHWALHRPGWQARPGDAWHSYSDWAALLRGLAPYRRPLFTLGREPLAHLDEVPAHQSWLIRCLDAHPGAARARILDARGPFALDAERRLFDAHWIDVLVSKNSGGAATEAKLQVARERGLSVWMPQRPPAPSAHRLFDQAVALGEALEAWREGRGDS